MPIERINYPAFGYHPGIQRNFHPGGWNNSIMSSGANTLTTTAQKSGILSHLQALNFTSISKYLNHIEKGLNFMQTITPVLKQYEPIIKNGPGLIQLFQLLNEQDESNPLLNEQKESHDGNIEEVAEEVIEENKPSKKVMEIKESKPKLFI